MQKPKDKYHNCGGKEKAAEYYLHNKYVVKEKTNKHKNLSEEEKKAKKEDGKNRYKKMKENLS